MHTRNLAYTQKLDLYVTFDAQILHTGQWLITQGSFKLSQSFKQNASNSVQEREREQLIEIGNRYYVVPDSPITIIAHTSLCKCFYLSITLYYYINCPLCLHYSQWLHWWTIWASVVQNCNRTVSVTILYLQYAVYPQHCLCILTHTFAYSAFNEVCMVNQNCHTVTV